jgi:hypothetical protein
MVFTVRVVKPDGINLYGSFQEQIDAWKLVAEGLGQLPDDDPRKTFCENVKKAAGAYGTAATPNQPAVPGPFKDRIDEVHSKIANLLLDMQSAGRWDVCGAIPHQTIRTMSGV